MNIEHTTGPVGEIIDVGVEIQVLMTGTEVGTPFILRLVLIVPLVLGFYVLRGGII
jgi:hypothetical protein